MESTLLKLIVPWDFSPVTENALLYALKISTFSEESSIDLIHVVEAGGLFAKGKMNEKEATERIKSDAARIKKDYGVEVRTVVQSGTIFHTISDYASDIQASMVIMGTHGIKGVQKLTGSWALKVIAGADVPFLVVQEAPKPGRIFENVVMPLDFKYNEKEKLHWVIKTSMEYKSCVHVIIPHVADSGIQKKISYNLAYAKKHLDSHEISYNIHSASKGNNFGEETIKLAVDIEADLIIIMTTPNLDLTDYMFGAQEQYVIANNARIPVLCINPAMT